MNAVKAPIRQRGVTLLELMIVVMIVGIITAIAVPSYRQQVVRSNRSNAKTAIMQLTQALERCYTRASTYTGCDDADLPVTTPEGLYTVTGVITGTSYDLTATPQGTQADDTTCGNLSLDEANVRLVSGTGTVDECWER